MKSENLYLNIINNLNDGVYFVDTKRRITFWNNAAEEISGYKAEEILGKTCESSKLNHIDATGKPLCIVGCPLYASIIDGKNRKAEVFLRHKKGYRVPILVNIFPMIEDGETIGAIEIFTQNSPTVYSDDLVEQLSNMAMRDDLTGLPNRRYLQSFLEYKLNEYKNFNKNFAVLFMDIDNFRDFNNKYGHDMGDRVLKIVSETIKKNARKSDIFGRWGGEEFVGVYAINDLEDAKFMAEKVHMLVRNTEISESESLSVTVSVGMTIVQNEDDLKSIIERADCLMYDSKVLGKDRVTVN